MNRTRFAAAVVSVGLVAVIASARADVRYAVTDLGALGGSTSYATAINASGQVVGTFFNTPTTTHAFLYSNGVMTDLGTLGGTDSSAADINDSGQVVGYADTFGTGPYGNHTSRAFLYADGTMTDLGVLESTNFATAINRSGQIAGYSGQPSYADGFLRDGDQTFYLTPFGYTYTRNICQAINDVGQIVGYAGTSDSVYHAFLMTVGINQPSHVVDLGTLGGKNSFAVDINDRGQTVGYAYTSDDLQHAFLYTDATGMTDIGTLGGSRSYAYGINGRGQIVGNSTTAAGATHAFLYTNDGMTDLNSLIEPSSGWKLTGASAINDAGQVVGIGDNPAGETHAFLLTLVPEPTGLSLLVIGTLVGSGRRRVRYRSPA
jgi:probable HAF family extracellular repeat protein